MGRPKAEKPPRAERKYATRTGRFIKCVGTDQIHETVWIEVRQGSECRYADCQRPTCGVRIFLRGDHWQGDVGRTREEIEAEAAQTGVVPVFYG